MITIQVEAGTPADREKRADMAIKKFNSRVVKSGLMNELKDREYYTKPSLKEHRRKQSGSVRF